MFKKFYQFKMKMKCIMNKKPTADKKYPGW